MLYKTSFAKKEVYFLLILNEFVGAVRREVNKHKCNFLNASFDAPHGID